MSIYLDEWGTPRSDTKFYPENHPVGFTYPCPQCGSYRTYASAGEDCWVCMDCGLVFGLSEAIASWSMTHGLSAYEQSLDEYIGEVDEYTVTRRLE